MGNYEPVIGLEIHAELKSRQKMFCGCKNEPFLGKVNEYVCPICLAHPGALPKPNEEPIKEIIKVGLALQGRLAETARFSRKNYFYPDLPKGYQITSQPDPFVFEAAIKVGERDIAIDHIHLEEDTGVLVHKEGETLVNFNRAGVPLLELVTEPVIRSGIEARKFCEELQLILRYLGVAEANMEKGEMRCEVNISLREKGGEFGTKVEIKNLNSFRVVEKSIEYEIERQSKIIDGGGEVEQETRGWDDIKGVTIGQRKKESAHDYRYFPEPDLLVLRLADFGIEKLKAEIPELPVEKRERLEKEYGLNSEQAEVLVVDRLLAKFFEEAASELKADDKSQSYKTLYNYLVSDLRGLMKSSKVDFNELKITPENLVDLVLLIQKNIIGSRVAKDVLKKMMETGADPRAIIKEEGLEQLSDSRELKKTIEEVIREKKEVAEEYRGGKEAALKFLIGQSMKKLKGRGEPKMIEEILREKLR